MNWQLLRLLSAMVWSVAMACGAHGVPFDVEARFVNVHGKDFKNLPVFIPVKSLFGRGIDFRQLDRDHFHIYDEDGREIPFMVRPLPPDFSISNDELVFFIEDFSRGAKCRYRFTHTQGNISKRMPLDIRKLVGNPNNWVANGGFEAGINGWVGGQVVTDVKRSGQKAMLLSATDDGEKVVVRYQKRFQFKPDGRYYFSLWAKSDNVARSAYRWQDTGGRIRLANDPFQGAVAKIQDTRDWYCYKPAFAGITYSKSRWRCESATFKLKEPYEWIAGKKRKTDLARTDYQSGLSLSLTQRHLPYIDAQKPARIWIDDILFFDQPQIIFDFDQVAQKAQLAGQFVYSRPVTLTDGRVLNHAPRPTPWEKVDRLVLMAARGERKVIPLGITLPEGGKDVFLENTVLAGPGRLTPGQIEYQVVKWDQVRWGDRSYWVYDLHRPIKVDPACHVDFFLAYDIPPQARPGTYQGKIDVKVGRDVIASVTVDLQVEDFSLRVIAERFIGSIFNRGMGSDGGVMMPPQDHAFLEYYRRSNFPYIMFFSDFLPFKGKGPEVDIGRLVEKMRLIKEVGITAGVGLYWDCSLDPFGRRGLWARSGSNPERYRQEVVKMDQALAEARLPRLVYMIWDEPGSPHAVTNQFGALKGTGAYTTCDAMGWAFYKTLNYITHTSYDDPAHEMGPAVYRYCHKLKKKFGLCGTAWVPRTARYQVGMMIAAADMHYWHQWHIMNMYGQATDTGQFVRNRAAVNFGEGMIDLRYHDTLVDVIAFAKKTGEGIAQANAAQTYLDRILGFCNGDQDEQATFYNGTPSDWGDDRFYDHWRNEMGRHIVAILKKVSN